MPIDDHYTPRALARIAVRHLTVRGPRVVADISAGEGSLLLEAERRWPSARFVATDIDRRTVRRLARLRRPGWGIGRCDFLSDKSRHSCRVLRKLEGSVDALLLNPPFSCRGGSYRTVSTPEGQVRASPAVAFLVVSLRYLSPRGEAVAILPAGAIHNRKDAAAWEQLRTRFKVRVLARWDKHSFPGCAASSILVKLTPAPSSRRRVTRRLDNKQPAPRHQRESYARIVRGTCPLHNIPEKPNGPTLVHYTDLKNAQVILNGHRGHGDHRCLTGPAVLIPRVGRISSEKIALFAASERVMISDCVIGLKTQSFRAAVNLRHVLLENFDEFARSYVGTGAPHITLERLRAMLQRLGVGEIND